MLKIEHLTKAYGSKKAVDDLSLHIAPGEVYGFIGHNGAGKTTTIKSVAGILPFDSGRILVDGVDIAKDPIACKQRMAYIPDDPQLYAFMRGTEYLNFVGDIYGVGAAQRQERIAIYAQAFDMTEDLGQAAAILKGKHIPPYARLLVVPASRDVLRESMEKGYIQTLIDAGATLVTPGCAACLGTHEGLLAPGEKCITCTNRNFRGRMGSNQAELFLASPATVAASILNGRITDPRPYLD